MKKNAKSRRADAEKAAVWFAVKTLNCLHVRKAIRSQWQSVDFFASDVVGKKKDGAHVYIQATAGQDSAVSVRRKKLEKYVWHESDQVFVVQLRQTQDPANARRKLWFFRVMVYGRIDSTNKREWKTLENAVPIPKEWFKAYK